MIEQILPWMRALGEPELATLLRLRPDGCAAPAPATLEDLADRLTSRCSVERACATLDHLALSLLEVMVGLGGPTREQLRAVVHTESVSEAAAVELALAGLVDRALCLEIDGRLTATGALQQLLSGALGLGRPAATILCELGAPWLQGVRERLGLPQSSSITRTAQAVSDHLSAERVHELLVEGGPGVSELVLGIHAAGSRASVHGGTTYSLLPTRWRQDSELTWAVDRALLLPCSDYEVELPREVGLALRGPDWTLGLAVSPPAIATAPADPASVEREAQFALSDTVRALTDVLDVLGASPAAVLKTSGIGVREIRRLAKAVGQDESRVTLVLELADAAGLLGPTDRGIAPSSAYDDWRAQQPAARAASLLLVWWQLPGALSGAVDSVGKPCPPTAIRPPLPEQLLLRRHVVEAAAALPPGHGAVAPEDLFGQVRWRAPLGHGEPESFPGAAAASWREALALGVCAHGRGSSLALALLGEDEEALRAQCSALLPAATSDVVFQSDLTALVTGAVPAVVATLLDAVAVREARGQAASWRFSPISVRRAFDSGWTAQALLDELSAISQVPLPQPLTYLLRDVDRRHGHLAVAPAGCVVTSTDEPLLAEVALNRALRALGARLVAPTVLVSSVPSAATLEALRAAGYLPVRHDEDGQVVLERVPQARSSGPRPPASTSALTGLSRSFGPGPRRAAASDPADLARRLIAADAKPRDSAPVVAPLRLVTALDDGLDTADEVAALAPRLSNDEAALLAHAIDTGGPVQIGYRDSNGTHSHRVISGCAFLPPFVEAWCHLRNDSRTFTVSSIVAVSPA